MLCTGLPCVSRQPARVAGTDLIATAWTEQPAGLDRMADADIPDSHALEALDRAERDLTTAGTEVETYLGDECGL
jgi:hypothetical protein